MRYYKLQDRLLDIKIAKDTFNDKWYLQTKYEVDGSIKKNRTYFKNMDNLIEKVKEVMNHEKNV